MWEVHCLSVAASHTLPVLVDAAIKSLVLLTLTGIATVVMRRSSAAARHLVWSLAIIGLLALPILSGTLPGWQILPPWLDVPSETAPARPPMPVPAPSPAADDGSASSGVIAEAPNPWVGTEDGFGGPDNPPTMTDEQRAASAAVVTAPPLASVAPLAPLTGPTQGNTSPKTEARDRPGRQQLWVWLPFVWAAGVVGVLGWVGAGLLNLWWLRRSCEPITDNAWAALLARVSDELNVRSSVSLLQCKHRAMPMVWGVFRPRLLLPAEAYDWPAPRRHAVLLHELAHVKRRDSLVQLITRLACALYSFNPLVWIAAGRMVTERERACDDLVLSAGSSACDYAEQILQIASGSLADSPAGGPPKPQARATGGCSRNRHGSPLAPGRSAARHS